jgi:hypothetical protein
MKMAAVTRPTRERIWIARLIDASCAGGYGRYVSGLRSELRRRWPWGSVAAPGELVRSAANGGRHEDALPKPLAAEREACVSAAAADKAGVAHSLVSGE